MRRARPSELSASDRSSLSIEEQGWIARIRGGDEAAFKAVYERYSDAMFAFAYSCLHTRPEAEDVVHDVFFNIVRNRATWEVTGELRTYLLRAVYNRVTTLRRHLRVEVSSRESIVQDVGSPEDWQYRSATDSPLLEKDLAEAIEKAVAALPPRAQQAYRLVRAQGLSYAAAADVMGVTVHTVELHLIRALKSLREQLARWR